LVNSVNEEGVLDAPGELKSIAYAQENAEFYGSEVEGVIGLLDGGSAGALDLRLFADYVRAGCATAAIYRAHYAVATRGRHRLRAGAVGCRYRRDPRGGQDDHIAVLETPTDGYTLLDANLTYGLVSHGCDYQFFV
jgi:iron complex outermembrane recepter protein